jgi:hypothetical protein
MNADGHGGGDPEWSLEGRGSFPRMSAAVGTLSESSAIESAPVPASKRRCPLARPGISRIPPTPGGFMRAVVSKRGVDDGNQKGGGFLQPAQESQYHYKSQNLKGKFFFHNFFACKWAGSLTRSGNSMMMMSETLSLPREHDDGEVEGEVKNDHDSSGGQTPWHSNSRIPKGSLISCTLAM